MAPTPGPAPRTKPIHRASLISPAGDVSALCFDQPKAINLKRATWTNRDEAVTCKECLARMHPTPSEPQ